jgi:hypothetical protein
MGMKSIAMAKWCHYFFPFVTRLGDADMPGA